MYENRFPNTFFQLNGLLLVLDIMDLFIQNYFGILILYLKAIALSDKVIANNRHN